MGGMTNDRQFFDHVIIGAGMAGAKALAAIQEKAPDASVALFGREPDAPVYRPDLSKTLWLDDDASLEKSTLVPGDDGALHRGEQVVRIDPAAHEIELEGGERVGYGSLLLATGSSPRTLEGLAPGERVIYYRTAADYRALRALAQPGSRVVVVGDGYIGTEIAAALSQSGVEVTLVASGATVMTHLFPTDLAQFATKQLTDHGVEIVDGRLAGGEVAGDGVRVRLEDGTTRDASAVVIGIGVQPNTKLAKDAGLTLDEGGIVVDDHLRTSAEDVYAAGDIAVFDDPVLGRRRVEHADAAESMGEAAGRIMAGDGEAYAHTPFFWSDLYDFGWEAIGEVITQHETVEDWADDDFGQGVVYYHEDGKVRGVLLWNVWDSTPKALEVMQETAQKPASPDELKGRIPKG